MTPDRPIEDLIRLAGGREMPSEPGMQRARGAAEAAWRRMLANGSAAPVRRPRAAWAWLAAAGVAALAVFAWRGSVDAPEAVARVVALQGETRLHLGDAIREGDTLDAGAGRIASEFAGGLSLRLDEHARVRFDGAGHVTLLAGTVYVDSGGLDVGPPLIITTPAGEVSHTGTQFLVVVGEGATRVRVREGRVVLAPAGGGTASTIAPGDELEMRGGQATWRRGLPSYGGDWDGPTSVAPILDIEGRPLSEFLGWLARERGWRLNYADDDLQRRAHEIRLHGSLDGLDPAAMLERTSLVTGLTLRSREGELLVTETP
ncbi:MAG TPA: FecR domain-containing protein [Steroidobacteraceae bacterium]|nr:FecR domain-containing protein [Steroidobacteraceae bacterium]